MADKRTTVDDIVGELRSGMTIGIGGWGSRRKPMAVVRAICRSDLADLTVVAYGGPDVGLLCATGKVRKVVCGFVTLDSIALDPHWRAARQHGKVEVMEVDEGMFFLGLQAAAWRVPFLPTRAGLGSDVLTINPDLRLVRSPYGAGSPFLADPADADVELVAMPALRLDAAIVHTNRADTAGNGQILGPDPFFDPLFLGAAERRFLTTERIVDERRARRRRPPALQRAHPPHAHRRRGRGTGRRALHRQPARLRARRIVPEGVRRRGRRPGRVGGLRRPLRAGRRGRVPGPGARARVAMSGRPDEDPGVTRAESCVVACADAWRGAGEVMASPFGTIPSLGARLAKLTFAPDLVLTDGEAALMVGAPPISTRAGRAGPRGGHALPQRLRRGLVGTPPHHDDGQPDRPDGEPEHLGHR